MERTDRMIAESRLIPFVEDQITGSLSLSVPFPSVRDQHAIGVSYSVNHYSMHTRPSIEHDPADRQPVYPAFLRYNALRVSWSYADLERDPEAFTTSRGRYASVSTGFRSPAIGADVQSADIVANAGWVHPLVRDRLVLASRIAGGLASASGIGRSAFVVGGQPPQDLALALLDRLPAGNTSIRGFEPGISSGDRFARAQLELRMPIARLGFGYSTVPLYLRRLHAAVFYDAGFASLEPAKPDDVLHGVGVELRLAATLGYVEPASFRLGLARGIGRQGIWDVYFLYGYEF